MTRFPLGEPLRRLCWSILSAMRSDLASLKSSQFNSDYSVEGDPPPSFFSPGMWYNLSGFPSPKIKDTTNEFLCPNRRHFCCPNPSTIFILSGGTIANQCPYLFPPYF